MLSLLQCLSQLLNLPLQTLYLPLQPSQQISAIFAIGRSEGYDPTDLKALITDKLGKSVSALTGREASKLIDDLRAL